MLPIQNQGCFGQARSDSGRYDTFTGEELESGCEFPKGMLGQYLFSASLWVGAVVGRDTLVSVGSTGWHVRPREMAPDVYPFGEIKYRSIVDPESPNFDGAVSEQDYICVYTDTMTDANPYLSHDVMAHRPHIPLNVEISQNTYAWSYGYAEDFVIFDLSIENIGSELLEQLFIGLYVDGDVHGGMGGGAWDDLCGFLKTLKSPFGCGFVDTVQIAWIADNNGDPMDGHFQETVIWRGLDPMVSKRHVTGTCILEPPSEHLDLSFNWWISNQDPVYDFGPRHRADFRDFGTGGLGTPEGDVNKYYQMSNYEFDYDQAFTAGITPYDTTWLYPDQDLAVDFADGYDTRYLLSYGAFTLYPGQALSLTFAYVAGENLHTDPNNLQHLPRDPAAFYDHLDFSDLVKNSIWARWIYDNPGVDTDGDGYRGKYRVCVYDSVATDTGWVITAAETTWYRGDGVPDFRGASPPPAPDFRVIPIVDGLKIRFNGHRSETEKDVFSHEYDFEGYRVYLGRDDRRESYSLVASYDRDNYDKYTWNGNRYPEPCWELRDIPFTLDDLRCLYGSGDDPCQDDSFDPLDYMPGSYYAHPEYPDSLFYFEWHDHNACVPGVSTPIRKVYPDELDPSTLPLDSLTPDRYTEDGYFKYYEYDYVIEGLLPTVPYWVNVTAFDHGSPKSDLEALETSVTMGAQCADSYGSEGMADGTDDRIYVYPNPYRIDGDYRSRGFEGRTELDRPDYRVRAIHFANLPPRCTIRIYSLDGDLVRELEHNTDPSDGTGNHHTWNLITRNTQMLVSGLYYWTVEMPGGVVQMGKLAVIM
ncbi:MAG: hypothetical protein KAU35_02410 [candidate division Zixibacteria bacterium]|nr:hypothetical protein [candidate division Zixibacteria bacterium]